MNTVYMKYRCLRVAHPLMSAAACLRWCREPEPVIAPPAVPGDAYYWLEGGLLRVVVVWDDVSRFEYETRDLPSRDYPRRGERLIVTWRGRTAWVVPEDQTLDAHGRYLRMQYGMSRQVARETAAADLRAVAARIRDCANGEAAFVGYTVQLWTDVQLAQGVVEQGESDVLQVSTKLLPAEEDSLWGIESGDEYLCESINDSARTACQSLGVEFKLHKEKQT